MTHTMRITRRSLLAATLAGAFFVLPQARLAAARPLPSGTAAQPQENGPEAAEAAARLNKKQYSGVKVTVENGIATLTGTVDLFEYKADAEKRVSKARGVTAVRNLIEVAGPVISDSEL